MSRLTAPSLAAPVSGLIQPDTLETIHEIFGELLPASKGRGAAPPGGERCARRLAFAGLTAEQVETLSPDIREALLGRAEGE